jgi:hypothetical protein
VYNSRVHESASRGHKSANIGHESAHSDCMGAQRGCESIQQSHGLNNTLTLVDCRGLQSALEAVRVSIEAMRVSIEALRCFRGHERECQLRL